MLPTIIMMANSEHISDSSLVIATYNCRGLRDDKREFVFQLLSRADVLFVQEHWMSDEQLDNFQSQYSDFYMHGICGFESSNILSGHPFGGCAFFWHRKLDITCIPVVTNSRRVCALKCVFGRIKLLFINV